MTDINLTQSDFHLYGCGRWNPLYIPRRSPTESSLADAEDFPRQVSANGRKKSKQIIKETEDAGVSSAALRRTQKRMGIKALRGGNPNTGQKWIRKFPEMINDMSEMLIHEN